MTRLAKPIPCARCGDTIRSSGWRRFWQGVVVCVKCLREVKQ